MTRKRRKQPGSPKGRVDILIDGIATRVLEAKCPQLAPHLLPLVREVIQENITSNPIELHPKLMGILAQALMGPAQIEGRPDATAL